MRSKYPQTRGTGQVRAATSCEYRPKRENVGVVRFPVWLRTLLTG
jgi:hypothetical protein